MKDQKQNNQDTISTNDLLDSILDVSKETLDNVPVLTAKGGVAYNSTMSDIVDLVYLNKRINKEEMNEASSLISKIQIAINNMLNASGENNEEAFKNKILALAVMLQNYDIKNGMGERTSSLLIAKNLLKDPYIRKIFPAIVPLILKYAGWRNLIALYNEPAGNKLILVDKTAITEEKALNEFKELNKNTIVPSNNLAKASYERRKKDFVKDKLGTTRRFIDLSKNASLLDIASRVAVLNEIVNNEKSYLPNSLMYKWMWHPGTSTETQRFGMSRFISDLNAAGLFHYHFKDYRQWLSNHRKESNLNLLETKLTNKDFAGLDLAKLPKRALRLHLKWFAEHTKEAYDKYIKEIDKDNKLNKSISVVECLHDFMFSSDDVARQFYAKQFFNAILNIDGTKSFLPVIDVSGSMRDAINSSSRITMEEAALALGLAMSFKNQGWLKNKVMPFSSSSKIIDLVNEKNFKDKDVYTRITQTPVQELSAVDQVALLNNALNVIHKYGSNYYENTDLAKAFEQLLKAGKEDASSVPESIVILSDGQFDPYHYKSGNNNEGRTAIDITSSFKEQFAQAGLKMPVVVYWNLKNANGVSIQNFLNQKAVLALSGFNARIITALYDIEDLRNLTSQQIATEMVAGYYNEILQAISKYNPKEQFANVKNNLGIFKQKYQEVVRNKKPENGNKKKK